MEMPGLTYSASDYRYGFNSKEKDAAFGLLHYDYGFRIYHPGLGRFLSVDPLARSYPMLTPYQFASNSPIVAIDLDGLEAIVVHLLGAKSKAVIDRATQRQIKSQIEAKMQAMDVNLRVKFIFQDKALSKSDFQNLLGYHENDSYVIVTNAGILKNISFKELGWQDPGLGSKIRNVSAPGQSENLKIVGTLGESARNDFIAAIDIEGASSIKSEEGTTTDYIQHLIEHESGHPKFKYHPMSVSDEFGTNVSLFGDAGHVSGTVMAKKVEGLGLGYDSYMIDMLQLLHGKVSDQWHPPMSPNDDPNAEKRNDFMFTTPKVVEDAQKIERDN